MNIANVLINVLNNKAREIETRMKQLETRVRTGALNNSISFKYSKGGFIFSALFYGKFQDEGTYRGRQQTDTSRRVWPKYTPRGRKNNPDSRGIQPLHFTRPMDGLRDELISIIKPVIKEEATKEIKKQLK